MTSPQKKPIMLWNADIFANKSIKSQIEKTWILLKQITIPGVGDFDFKVGNKDYHLAVTEPTSSGASEISADEEARRYKTISELNLKKKYRYFF